MSTSHSTGFPITTYSVPGKANMLANEQVSFARGQQHNQADVSDAIELILTTFIGKRAFAALQSGLEYLSGTPDGKISFVIFGTTLEDELLEWADGHGKGIFGIRREDLANRDVHADRTSVTPERTYHIVTQHPPPTQSVEKYIPTIPTSLILQESSPSSPCPIGSNPKPLSPPSSPPRPVPNTQTCHLTNRRGARRGQQEVILQIPAARTPSERQSRMSKGQKGSPPGATRRPETGSPSNPINVDDDAAMIDQLYAGTYTLGDDDPTTPQSDTSSNTRRKYHKGVRNNAPYCQYCGWSDHRTYYCEAYYCPDCDRRAPGHSFNWCPIRREDEDRILMERLHGDVSYDNSYNIDGEGTEFW
ncbi:hypothetical protein SERLA73DRAFT_68368 [Serpula lacrymans var. lacrymans S7.3]|uniref:Uncharacterized protein n=2 Tax=Serpula lacrymans var. lacrymans TaxID=341189 RepID=F8PF21_SERL3|nr:uncharacterized protein SERLADRAFT_432117 [Serpula lacrymans var. lacrymans S7.9]EGO04694.1 hypothetical protein SERLA73DRAFT_68368 [Serpula lacrymans var. lacrymans S7.3]EGO30543.1 hypothetical protein SERLADRAFT_432117 [Serpula lacrymans var. lacrymans S7.9]